MTTQTHRIRYVGRVPEAGEPLWRSEANSPPPRAAELDRALRRLSTVRQEIVERRFWRGQSLAQIGRSLDLAPARVRRELRRALADLRRCLTARSKQPTMPHCKLCNHPERGAVERLLRTRRPEDTWRGYLRRLKQDFGIAGLPAKALESHLHHHTQPEEDKIDLTGKRPR